MLRVGTDKPAAAANAPGRDRLKEVAQEFEAVFAELILKQARTSSRALSEEKPGFGRDTYESWQDQERARAIAASGGLGLAEILYRQLQQSAAQQMPR